MMKHLVPHQLQRLVCSLNQSMLQRSWSCLLQQRVDRERDRSSKRTAGADFNSLHSLESQETVFVAVMLESQACVHLVNTFAFSGRTLSSSSSSSSSSPLSGYCCWVVAIATFLGSGAMGGVKLFSRRAFPFTPLYGHWLVLDGNVRGNEERLLFWCICLLAIVARFVEEEAAGEASGSNNFVGDKAKICCQQKQVQGTNSNSAETGCRGFRLREIVVCLAFHQLVD